MEFADGFLHQLYFSFSSEVSYFFFFSLTRTGKFLEKLIRTISRRNVSVISQGLINRIALYTIQIYFTIPFYYTCLPEFMKYVY